MKLSTLFVLILVCLNRTGFSQTLQAPENKTIRIMSLASAEKGAVDLDVIFTTKGIYHFELDKNLSVPKGYLVIIKDPMNDLEISVSDTEPYYFTISRPVFKRLKISLKKNEELLQTLPSLVVN
ncbi:MAG: hypothetical protein JNL60_01320 [Bacteroidia bacterium]|nr:hypothetical protein [Bacteroidia bacterium]